MKQHGSPAPAKQRAPTAKRHTPARKKRAADDGAAVKVRGAVQAGARAQPRTMPAQHLKKSGQEVDLKLQPRYLAPDYRGSGKLEGFGTLITGADSGIGRAVAVLFAREGADVALAYHSSTDDAKETQQLVQREGSRCILLRGNVRNSRWCDGAVARTVKAFGRLDVLVNNAAVQQHAGGLTELDDKRLLETFDTNILGYFRMARAALPYLRRGASIINTGSVVGLRGSAKLLDYSATKGAIHAFTKSLASNLMSQGIRVNAIAPGPVWTPLNPADLPAAKVAEFGLKADMKRAAQPEELSPAYVFLASPVSSGYIGDVPGVVGT